MDRSTLKALAVAIAGLMIVVLVAGLASGGMSSKTKSVAKAEVRRLDESLRELDAKSRTIVRALDQGALFGAARKAAWQARLDTARQAIEDAKTAADRAEQLLAENDEEQETELVQTIESLRAARAGAEAEIGDMAAEAERRIAFAENRGEVVAELKLVHQRLRGQDLVGLSETVAAAASRWPGKKADLEGRSKRSTIARRRVS